MSEDNQDLSDDICGWIIRAILVNVDETELDLDDQEIREAVVEALKNASDYFNNFNRTLH